MDSIGVGVVDTSGTERPRSLAIHPIKRLIFWTDAGVQQSITRARLDGSAKNVLAYKLDGITALALDISMNMLYFAHGKSIDMMDINGKNRYVSFD